MRPVHLHLQGFAAFREPTDVDFDGVEFFALVGPTGAGKSSVIDAICFALYGIVPRYDDARAVAPALSSGANELRIVLVFDSGAQRYRVLRTVKLRSGRPTTTEARLERLDPDGTVESLAGSARELDPAVEAVVGLNFQQFTKCVVLPQGDFARFLHDKPSDRQDLLVRLLDLGVYERVQQRAGQRRADADRTVEQCAQQLADLGDVSDERVRAAQARAESLGALLARVQAEQPASDARSGAHAAARATAERSRQVLDALAVVAVPADLDDFGARLDAARTELDAAERAASAANDAFDAVRAQTKELPDASALARAAQAHRDRGEAVTALDTARAEAQAIDIERAAAQPAVDAARAGVEAAAAELVRQRTAHAPHALAAGLVVGEACPVCEQTVHALPAQRHTAALTEVEQLDERARTALHAAESALREIEKRSSVVASQIAERAKRVEGYDAALRGHPDPLVVDAQIAQHEALQLQVESATAAQRAADARRRAAAKAIEALQASTVAYRREFTKQRDGLAGLDPAPPDLAEADIAGSWQALHAYAVAARPAHERAASEAELEIRRLIEQERELLGRLRVDAEMLGVEPAGKLAALAVNVATASANAANDAKQLVERRAAAEQFQRRADAAKETAAVAGMLHRLLGAKGFERWLLDEALDALVDGASRTLERLTAGAYSLARDDKEFLVIDHVNAGERRPVRTLSGGETFQASLAFALALAEQVSALAAGSATAKLESLFLDEGFGTLDAETLETVSATIETLAGTDRMVGVVTHVRELAERVPVRYEVEKIGRSSHVTRVEQ